jgi:tetratricopeptide (TPR) repeat protein
MENIRKHLPDRTQVDRVNHQEQSAEDNLTDMIAGFFSGNLLNRENLRLVIEDVIEYLDNNPEPFGNDTEEMSEELKKEIAEADEVIQFKLSTCYVYECIARVILKELGDLEFARQIFKRAEEIAKDTADLSCLAESILYYLQDEEWHERLMSRAHSEVNSWGDLLAIYSDSGGIEIK